MNRSQMVVASVGIPAFVLLAALSAKGTDPSWQPEEARSVMFRPLPDVQSGRPSFRTSSATLAKWNAPRGAVSDVAGREYLPGTRQPLGMRMTLMAMRSSAAKEDEPMSAMSPNGPVCSVNTPTGPSPRCSTPSTGCDD